MRENCFCKECKRYVSEEEFYHQGRVCKKCRSQKSKDIFNSLTGLELAEELLHKSCENVFDRVRSDRKEAYKGVECAWSKPKKMKEDLMSNRVFWDNWVKQSKIYEENDRVLKFRPTIDRIESDVTKGGHYTMENIQVLSYGENTVKAKAVNCKVIFIKNLRVVKVTDYNSAKDVMKELGIKGYNAMNLIKNNGKLHNIGNGYSVFIQTSKGMLNNHQDSPIYKAVITRQKILVDNVTGEEYLLSSTQKSFDTYGIWFDENPVMNK